MPTRPLTEAPTRMFSPSQIAARTGTSVQTIYAAINRGDLPAYRVGTRLRITEADLLAWITPAQSADVEAAS